MLRIVLFHGHSNNHIQSYAWNLSENLSSLNSVHIGEFFCQTDFHRIDRQSFM